MSTILLIATIWFVLSLVTAVCFALGRRRNRVVIEPPGGLRVVDSPQAPTASRRLAA